MSKNGTTAVSNGTTKPLRFASLIRVSTEKQEKEGESLATQRENNGRDVERLGGHIIETYGGQEHATAGWEKKEVNRLLADAGKGKFDAVIVAFHSRWLRDNEKSEAGLDVLKRHGIRFFVGASEKRLHEPADTLMLRINVAFSQYQSEESRKISLEVRIKRARDGRPTSGKLPFGRTYSVKGGWGVDPDKHDMIRDVAERYLAGESLPDLAKE
jgi:DNA invertase Pin-like site-specific DNA recombinase